MAGETDLKKMLETLSPELMDGEFVFVTFADAKYGDRQELAPVVTVSETEGLTMVITRPIADAHGIPYESVFSGITLKVHSSLEAVGLTAAFATKLTAHGISANVVAGFYHDHLFVQSHDAQRAIEALHELSEQ